MLGPSGHLLRLNSGVIGDHMVTAQMPAFPRVWDGGRFDSYYLTVSKRNEIFSSKWTQPPESSPKVIAHIGTVCFHSMFVLECD